MSQTITSIPAEPVTPGDIGWAEALGRQIAVRAGKAGAAMMANVHSPEFYPIEVKLPDDPSLARRVREVTDSLLNDAGWQTEWLEDEDCPGAFVVCLAKRVFTTRWWPPAWTGLVVSVVLLAAGAIVTASVPMSIPSRSVLISVLCVWLVVTCWRATASDGRWLWQTLLVICQVRRYLPPGWKVITGGGWIFIEQKTRKQDRWPLMFPALIETTAAGGAYADLTLAAWADIWQASDVLEDQYAEFIQPN